MWFKVVEIKHKLTSSWHKSLFLNLVSGVVWCRSFNNVTVIHSISLHLLALYSTASILKPAFPLWLKDDCIGFSQLQTFENKEGLFLVVPTEALILLWLAWWSNVPILYQPVMSWLVEPRSHASQLVLVMNLFSPNISWDKTGKKIPQEKSE